MCDVDANRLAAGNAKVAGGKAAEYADYRKLLDRNDIDVVTIGTPGFPNGILIEGKKGSIFVARGKLTGAAVEALAVNPLPEDLLTSLRKGKPLTSHMRNFFDCIKHGGEPISDAASHHRSLTTCHLANIAIRLGRPIRWDPAEERVIGDGEAAAMVKREQRKPYELPM